MGGSVVFVTTTPRAVVPAPGAAAGEAAHASIAIGRIVLPVAPVLLRSRVARGTVQDL